MSATLLKKALKVLTLLQLQKRILSKKSLHEAFNKSIDNTNIIRLRVFCFFVILFTLAQLFNDFIIKDFWNLSQQLYFRYIDFTNLIISLIILFFAFYNRNSKSEASLPKNKIVTHILIVIVLIYTASISSAEQYVFYYTPTFTFTTLIISILFFIDGWILLLYFLTGSIILLLNPYRSFSNEELSSVYYGSIYIVVPVSWIISRILMYFRKENFIDKYHLSVIRNDLERQVHQRTKEYIDTNIELERKIELQKQYEDVLKKAKKKAEESDKLKSAFLANISHEVRTPMNAIVGFTDLLVKTDPHNEEKKQRYGAIIKNRSHDLIKIIDDLIMISKIESGQIEVFTENVNLNRIYDDIHFDKSNKIKLLKKFNLEIVLKKQFTDENSNIKTDKFKLQHILDNLVDNAIKFTETGTIEVSYKVADKDFIQFAVADTGIGIREDTKIVIFDTFRQSELGMSRKYHGIGLGLSLCKEFANILDGKIWLESEQNKGTKVFFTIPYVPINETNKEKNNEIKYPSDIIDEKDEKTILIVEDDSISRDYFSEILNLSNIKLEFAYTGKEAVKKATGKKLYDLVLMDIQLPDISGIEVTKKIKKKYKDITIIAQSAYTSQEVVKDCMNAGCDDFVPKPIDNMLLYNKIREYLV